MYDPILCMNVPDSVKTKDATFIIEAKKEGHPYKAIVNGTEQELRKYYSHKGFTDIVLKQTKGKDSKAIDKAIRNCDDLNSDKEKALEEYKKAKKTYEEKSANAKTLQEFKELENTKEFKEFMDKKRVCMKLGCRI